MDYKPVLQIEQKLGLFTTWTNWGKKLFTPSTVRFMLSVNIFSGLCALISRNGKFAQVPEGIGK